MTSDYKRRSLFAALVAGPIGGCIGRTGQSPSQDLPSVSHPDPDFLGSWNSYRSSNTNDGVGSCTIGRTADGKVWERELDRTLSTEVAVDRQGVVIGGGAGTVVSVDPETGTKNWEIEVDELLLSTPAITDELAIITSGSVYAFGRERGELQWERATNGTANQPKIHDGSVFVTESLTGGVRRLEIATGEEVWSKKTQASEHPPAVDETGVYVFTNQNILRLDHQGATQWRQRVSARRSPASPPVLTGSRVVYSTKDGKTACLSKDDGTILWETTLEESAPLSTPAISPQGVVVQSNGRDTILLDKQTGQVVDSVRVSEKQSGGSELISHDPVLCGDRVMVHGGDRDVHVVEVDQNSMRYLGTVDIDRDVTTTPVVVNGVLYTSSKHVSAISL